MHYATLTGNPQSLQHLLANGCDVLVNRNDFITGFTPLHLALFTQNKEIMWLLLQRGAEFTVRYNFLTSMAAPFSCGSFLMIYRDNYFATPLDYARLVGILPSKWDERKKQAKFNVYNEDEVLCIRTIYYSNDGF